MKTIFMTALLTLATQVALASGIPDVHEVYVNYCYSDPRYVEASIKKQAMIVAKVQCIEMYGSESNCEIHEDTFSFAHGYEYCIDGWNYNAWILITKKK